MVSAKPRQVTSVRAVPVAAAGARRATKAENCGESATTAILHTSMAPAKTDRGSASSTGLSRQQLPDTASAVRAVRRPPTCRAR